MTKFLLAYKGAQPDMSAMSKEDTDATMAQWGEWMAGVGSALVDGGMPTGASSSIVDDGSDGDAMSITGYSIIEADDMATARAMCDGHPFLSDDKGDYAIDVYELMVLPGM